MVLNKLLSVFDLEMPHDMEIEIRMLEEVNKRMCPQLNPWAGSGQLEAANPLSSHWNVCVQPSVPIARAVPTTWPRESKVLLRPSRLRT